MGGLVLTFAGQSLLSDGSSMMATAAELDVGSGTMDVTFTEDITSDPAMAREFTAYTSTDRWIQDLGNDPILLAPNILRVFMVLDAASGLPINATYANTGDRIEGDPGNLCADQAVIPLTLI